MPATTPTSAESSVASDSIWTRPDRGARGPRPELTRQEITSAAIVLADSGGLAALSMRAVAGALGTKAGSLYRYLSSRDDLLDLMVDAVLAELRPQRVSAGRWLDDLVAVAGDQLALYRRHPWLLDAGFRGGAFGPNATDYFEYCLLIMAPLTSGTAAKMEAIAMITGVVSLFVRAAPVAADPTPEVAAARIFGLASAERHPHLWAALTSPGPAVVRPDTFEQTVRSVLEGLLGTQSGSSQR